MRQICIDCRMVHHSGIGTYICNIVPEVIKSMQNVHFFLLGKNAILQKLLSGIDKALYDVVEVDAKIFSLQEQMDYWRKIPSNIDLLWVPNFNIPWFYSGKLLVTVHDVFHLAMPNLVGRRYKYWYAKWLFSKVRKNAAQVLTVSEFSKSELIRLGGFSGERVKAIHLGVDQQQFFSKNKEDVVSPYAKPYILFVGNVKPNKNVIRLLKAYAILKNQVSFDLVIVGKRDGFLTGDTAVCKAYQTISDRVTFTGYVSDELLLSYYRHALLFVFPSLYEGFGLPLLEAMACGCPVVASTRASLPEVAGDAAIYANPMEVQDLADKILLVASDRILRDNLRAKGYRRLKMFSWEKCVQETCRVIEELVRDGNENSLSQ